MKLIISHEAEQDLQSIMQYIGVEQENMLAAKKILTSIRDLLIILPDHPHLGRPCSELSQFVAGLRCLGIEGYNVYYRVNGEKIEIARIIHERRDKEKIFAWWLNNHRT